MTTKEANRLSVMHQIDKKMLSIRKASEELGLSYRHTRRLRRQYEAKGKDGLISKRRGHLSPNCIPRDVRNRVIELLKGPLLYCGSDNPTLPKRQVHFPSHRKSFLLCSILLFELEAPMHRFRLLTHLLLLVTTPSLLVYPESNLRPAYFHVQKVRSKRLNKNFRKEKRYSRLSYDEILELLSEIESGKTERNYQKDDWKCINQFLSYLVQKGTLPNSDTSALVEDIEELLCDEDDYYEYAFSLGDEPISLNF